jgi:AP-5 complex subunit mu-1
MKMEEATTAGSATTGPVPASSSRARLLLQLKLDQSVNNSFEYLQVVLPFRNRGAIAGVQATPSTGSVSVAPDKAALVWNIGQRIGAQNLEVALPAMVSFEGAAVAAAATSDPFCAGLTCYARVRFRVLNWTPSSCVLDPKKISVYPALKTRPAIVVEHTAFSGEYIIWNSLGKSRRTKPLSFP